MGQCWPSFRRRVRELNVCCAGGSGHNRYTEFAPQDKMKYSDETLLHQMNSGRPVSSADVVYEGVDNQEGAMNVNDYSEEGEQYRGAIRLPQNDEDEDASLKKRYGQQQPLQQQQQQQREPQQLQDQRRSSGGSGGKVCSSTSQDVTLALVTSVSTDDMRETLLRDGSQHTATSDFSSVSRNIATNTHSEGDGS
ncbi:uncharacterized protein LOC135828791 [Sycon ciliatum]|uniref:uncharacterized protein LOC135828791 n=1 Tax=Sycon ciliatum TaxID=27933 RepID=UPI0020AD0399|eukprot:scpid94817/ scgid17750/ 